VRQKKQRIKQYHVYFYLSYAHLLDSATLPWQQVWGYSSTRARTPTGRSTAGKTSAFFLFVALLLRATVTAIERSYGLGLGGLLRLLLLLLRGSGT
jgi:hypothetical protein